MKTGEQVMIKAPWDEREYGPYTVESEYSRSEHTVKIDGQYWVVPKDFCHPYTPPIAEDELCLLPTPMANDKVNVRDIGGVYQFRDMREVQHKAIPLYRDAPRFDEVKADDARVFRFLNSHRYITESEYNTLRDHFTNGTGKSANPDLLKEFSK